MTDDENYLSLDEPQNLVRSEPQQDFLSTEGVELVYSVPPPGRTTLVGDGEETFLTCSAEVIHITEGGGGSPSAGGSSSQIYAVAGETIPGHRVVYIANDALAYICKSTDLSTRNAVGLTTASTAIGGNALIVTSGKVIEPSWSWTPGEPVYAGPLGLLTQTPPATGWCLLFGFAATADSVIIGIQDSIQLAS